MVEEAIPQEIMAVDVIKQAGKKKEGESTCQGEHHHFCKETCILPYPEIGILISTKIRLSNGIMAQLNSKHGICFFYYINEDVDNLS